MNESELRELLDSGDQLLRSVSQGEIEFQEFIAQYGMFYWEHCLGGEGGEEWVELLGRYAQRVAVHKRVLEEVLLQLCSDEDAVKPDYQAAGFIGSGEARARISAIVGATAARREGGP